MGIKGQGGLERGSKGSLSFGPISSSPRYRNLFSLGSHGSPGSIDIVSQDDVEGKVLFEFVLNPTQRLELLIPRSHTVSQVKDEIAAQAQLKYNIALDPKRGFDLKLPGAPFLTQGNMVLAELPYVINCQHRARTPIFLVLDKKSDITRDYKNENVTIGAIIGHSLGWTLKDEEITEYRQSMAKQRYDNYIASQRRATDEKILKSRSASQFVPMSLPLASSSSPSVFKTPSTPNARAGTSLNDAAKKSRSVAASVSSGPGMPSLTGVNPMDARRGSVMGSRKVLVKLRHENGTFSTIAVNLDEDSADAVITRCFNAIARMNPEFARGRRAESFVLKPIGLATFIHGPMMFSAFKSIAENIMQRKETQVDLVERELMEEEENKMGQFFHPSMTLEERLWEYTEVSAIYDHAKITIEKERSGSVLEEMQVMSVWDIRRTFKIRILGIDNLYIPSNISATAEVRVMCGLYEGTNLIGKSFCSDWVLVPPPSSSPSSSTAPSSSSSPATTIFPLAKSQIDFGGFSAQVPLLCDLPRATQLCFSIWIRSCDSSASQLGNAIAWANKPIFDFDHELVTGHVALSTWPSQKHQFERYEAHPNKYPPLNPRGTSRPNYSCQAQALPFLYLQFEEYQLPVVFPTVITLPSDDAIRQEGPTPSSSNGSSSSSTASPPSFGPGSPTSNVSTSSMLQNNSSMFGRVSPPKTRISKGFFPSATSMTNGESSMLKDIVSGYPIDPLSRRDKNLLWRTRNLLKIAQPKGISKFLQSIPLNYQARLEAYAIMRTWKVEDLEASDFLELLDAKFADPTIRSFAVDQLDTLSDEDIGDYLLQLIQALRYEPYLDCALTRFLLRRSVQSPTLLGHFFFWYLKSELHNSETFERNGLLLEAFLRACSPSQRTQLGLQTQLVQSLLSISQKIVKCEKDKLSLLKNELHLLNQNLFQNWTLSPPGSVSSTHSGSHSSNSSNSAQNISSSSFARQSVSFTTLQPPNASSYSTHQSHRNTISRQNSIDDRRDTIVSPASSLTTSLLASSSNQAMGSRDTLMDYGVDQNGTLTPNSNSLPGSESTTPSGYRSPSSPSSPRGGSSVMSGGVGGGGGTSVGGQEFGFASTALGSTSNSVSGNGMMGPVSIKLPLNPLIEVSGLMPGKCKVMKSKKEPLWLCFQNADPKSGPYLAMFKAGDDLRQDMLVLQLFKVMDRLWKSHGLYLDMAIYSVLATGDQCGFVEIVTKSKTISELQGLSAFKDEVLFNFILEHNPSSDSSSIESSASSSAASNGSSSNGSTRSSDFTEKADRVEKSPTASSSSKGSGTSTAETSGKTSSSNMNGHQGSKSNLGATGTQIVKSGSSSSSKPSKSSSKSSQSGIQSQQQGGSSPTLASGSPSPIQQELPITIAVGRFIRSCAAYCVATYVLGIGDRHNGNVMMREDGTLFHIDFGHMLGNFKEKLGIRRERVPFVFTPEMVYVMGDITKTGGDGFYSLFTDLCSTAYNLLRVQASLFMNLFAMMMSSGMPELQTEEDLYYLKDTLDLDLSDSQAAQKFSSMLDSSSKALSTRVNWFFHNLAQRLK